MSTQRERFESHFIKDFEEIMGDDWNQKMVMGYVWPEVQAAWVGWKAAEAVAIDRCAELCRWMGRDDCADFVRALLKSD